jgi:hypothetical protein
MADASRLVCIKSYSSLSYSLPLLNGNLEQAEALLERTVTKMLVNAMLPDASESLVFMAILHADDCYTEGMIPCDAI